MKSITISVQSYFPLILEGLGLFAPQFPLVPNLEEFLRSWLLASALVDVEAAPLPQGRAPPAFLGLLQKLHPNRGPPHERVVLEILHILL